MLVTRQSRLSCSHLMFERCFSEDNVMLDEQKPVSAGSAVLQLFDEIAASVKIRSYIPVRVTSCKQWVAYSYMMHLRIT